MTTEELYQSGIFQFERGNYRESVKQLEQASSLAGAKTKQGGEIQVWLVNAYDAAGRSNEAIELCRSLSKHPSSDVRKSASYVLGILTAPKLADLQDVTTDISNFRRLDVNRSSLKEQTGTSTLESDDRLEQKYGVSTNQNPNNRTGLWFAIVLGSLALTISIYLFTR